MVRIKINLDDVSYCLLLLLLVIDGKRPYEAVAVWTTL